MIGLENLGVLTPASFECIQVGCTHKALMGIPNGFQQGKLPAWIQFGQHVI